MKRIILGIICIFSINVYAENFYTDYKLDKENTTIYFPEYENNELKKYESRVVYNNYKEIKSSGNYYELGKNPVNYPYSDLDDYIDKNSYAKKPYNTDDEQYNTLRINKYSTIRMINLRSFVSSAILKEIIIKYNDEIINYTIYETNYNFDTTLNNNHYIVLDLGQNYDLDKLTIKLVFEDNTRSYLAFMLNVYNGTYYIGAPYAYYDNIVYRNNDIETYNINFISNDSFNEFLPKISWIKSRNYDSTNAVNYYKQTKRLYKYFTYTKEYLSVFTDEPLEGYKLDYDYPVTIYNYYSRDFISVNDNLDNLEDLNKIIVSSSIDINDIDIQSKIMDEYILVTISYNNNTFFKKYPLIIDNTNNENEVSLEKEEENIIEEIILNEQDDILNTLNALSEENIKEDITQITINDTVNEEKPKEDIDQSQLVNDNNQNRVKVYVPKKPLKNNEEGTKEEIIALANKEKASTSEGVDTLSKKTNKCYLNLLIILIIILICVKLLSLYLNKKRSFVEHV